MVKANELRVGNKVATWIDDDIIAVTEIIGHYVIADDGRDLLFKHLFGIPLTEEILLKCGFIGNEDEMHVVLGLGSGEELSIEFITDTACLTRSQPKYNRNDTLDFCYIKYPEYLHQLQNLYFALTGKELEISL